MSGGSSDEEAGETAPSFGQQQQQPPKPTPKILRVLTVLAYVMSVSTAAVLLSLYYIFLWDPQTAQPRTSALQAFPEPRIAPPNVTANMLTVATEASEVTSSMAP